MLTFLNAVWSVTLELAPWLFLGLIVAALMHILVPAGLLARHLTGTKGVFKAVAIGVPLPLCSCGVIPAGIGLKRDGASSGSAIGFLIATPQTGVDSIFVSASMLGWPFALLKVAAALVSGVIGGWLVEKADTPTPATATHDQAAMRTTSRSIASGWHQAVDILRSIWGWLVFGILVSAALTAFIPENTLGEVFGNNIILASLAALLISLPLYVCATGSVPIAAALVAAGLPIGAALVFLMAGPATNVATIGAVRRAFGGRAAAIYLATIIVGSMSFGLLFDGVLSGLFTGEAAHAHHHGTEPPGIISILSGIALGVAATFFAVEDIRQRLHHKRSRQAAFHRQVTVDGLTCQNCVLTLEKALLNVPGVALAAVDLATQTARVRFDQASAVAATQGDNDSTMAKAIEAVGYDVVKFGDVEAVATTTCDHGHCADGHAATPTTSH